jgi:hypothetical protein
MLVKLYKNVGGIVHYHEAWNDRNRVILHWGVLGRIGDKRIITVNKGETVESVVQRELAKPRRDGYQEIADDEHKLLVIQYKLQNWGSVRDLEKRHEVEAVVNECLGWTGNGHCDGGDIGSGTINIFSYVIDPIVACKNIVMDLRDKGLPEGAVIAFADDDFKVLWPENHEGSLSI